MPDFSNITPYQTRKTLIEYCKLNDPAAWQAFYTPYRNYARAIIKSKYGFLSSDECDELAHEAVVKVTSFDEKAQCRGIDKYDPNYRDLRDPEGRAKFHNWFYGQVWSVARDYCRKRLKNQEVFEFNPDLDADVAEFDARFHEEREQAIQTKAMELLAQSRTNKRNIEAFQMFLNDRSVADIAAELGMAENSVHQAVSRCRRFLTERRKMLEELL